MSAVAIENPGARAPRTPAMTRLIKVELRKAVDTRAGFWLLAVVGLLALVAAFVRAFTGDSSEQSLEQIFLIAGMPVTVLLPVVGILAVTSEWSQRTALSTFTLVPRRGRVALAKVGAAAVIGLLSAVVMLVVALLASAVSGAPGGWDLSGAAVVNSVVTQVLSIVGGTAFGMLFLNSPVAIVLSFALPTAWGILAALVSGLNDAARWLDTSRTFEPLGDPSALSTLEWERLATSVAVWTLLPLLVGAWRLMRKEVA